VRGHRLLDFGVGRHDTDLGSGADSGQIPGQIPGQIGGGQRLECWGDVVLARPDARATGPRALDADAWSRPDATFEGRIGGGRWRSSRPLPDRWPIDHAGHRFLVGCAPSGHTGLFPEQAAHWSWMVNALTLSPGATSGETSGGTPGAVRGGPAVLNLFAYTGGASVALAAAGAHVTHVDASRPAIGWARENAALNGVSTIRWIHEDARRFVDRERRRGRQYDALLLDPPAFGRGPAGDWQLDRDLAGLLEAAIALLRPDPAFVLLNVYTGDLDAGDLDRLLAWALDARPDAGGLGPIEADTLSLTSADGRHLPTGVYARAARGRT
jgi:23S rRNA (cytosine1962-C5)-methyltransferase